MTTIACPVARAGRLMRWNSTGWHHAALEPTSTRRSATRDPRSSRHRVGAEGALVAGDRRGHAEARVGVDVGRADEALHQLVGDVIVLGQQLAGDDRTRPHRRARSRRPRAPAPRPRSRARRRPPGAAGAPRARRSRAARNPSRTAARGWPGDRGCRPPRRSRPPPRAHPRRSPRRSTGRWCDSSARPARSSPRRRSARRCPRARARRPARSARAAPGRRRSRG
jgi:hypothetical protein